MVSSYLKVQLLDESDFVKPIGVGKAIVTTGIDMAECVNGDCTDINSTIEKGAVDYIEDLLLAEPLKKVKDANEKIEDTKKILEKYGTDK